MIPVIEILKLAKEHGITSPNDQQIAFAKPSRLCIEGFAEACYRLGLEAARNKEKITQ